LYDTWTLEKRNVPSVALCTEPFGSEATAIAKSLGLPDMKVALIPHPVAALTPDQVNGRADLAWPQIQVALTSGK
jgi:hypothetical protein